MTLMKGNQPGAKEAKLFESGQKEWRFSQMLYNANSANK